jgi:uncharacterized protein (DUF2461 family)
MAEFHGWDTEFVAFFEDLERHNDKDWFDRHRDTFQHAVRAPTAALVAELEPSYGAGRIFRINRDARFTAGQPPYRTNVAAEFGGTGVHHYLSASATELNARGRLRSSSPRSG